MAPIYETETTIQLSNIKGIVLAIMLGVFIVFFGNL